MPLKKMNKIPKRSGRQAGGLDTTGKHRETITQAQTQPAAPVTVSNTPGSIPLLQRKSLCPCDGGCPRCSAIIQPKSVDNRPSSAVPALQSTIRSLKGSGQPLSAQSRAFFEPRFGRDFSGVRVHNDAEAARALNAKAFTMGNNVVFGAGRYSPGTAEGKKLLAHELTHVVQQHGEGRIQRVGNPITEADLASPTESGITTDEAELRTFMCDVFRRQVLLWTALGSPYVHEIPSSELFTMPSTYAIPNRTVKVLRLIQHPVTNMIDDARAEMNRQNGVGGPADGVTGVALRSGYRSAESQFNIWTRWAPEYYNRTQADRRDTSRFPLGEHSDDAAQYLAEYTNQRVFSPGYSPHQMGTAVDVSYEKGGDWAEADSTPASISTWESSWLFDWLSQNALRYGFVQNHNINEPWHWEFNPLIPIILLLMEVIVSVMMRNIIIGQLYLGRERTAEDNETQRPEQGEEE